MLPSARAADCPRALGRRAIKARSPWTGQDDPVLARARTTRCLSGAEGREDHGGSRGDARRHESRPRSRGGKPPTPSCRVCSGTMVLWFAHERISKAATRMAKARPTGGAGAGAEQMPPARGSDTLWRAVLITRAASIPTWATRRTRGRTDDASERKKIWSFALEARTELFASGFATPRRCRAPRATTTLGRGHASTSCHENWRGQDTDSQSPTTIPRRNQSLY